MAKTIKKRRSKPSAQAPTATVLDEILATLEVPPYRHSRAREVLAPLTNMGEFLTGVEVDDLLRFSRRKRQRLVQAGFLQELRNFGTNPVYLRLDVARYILRGTFAD